MEKVLRKIRYISILLLASASFLLTGCENLFSPSWDDPVKEFFKTYTETAAIESQELDGDYPQNTSGVTCIPSGDSRTVTFLLRNPQNYVLEPGFVKPDGTPYTDTEVIIEQDATDHSIIKLRYIGSFLKDKDKETASEDKSLSGNVTLLEPMSGRYFDQWPVTLSANSVPLPIKSPIFQVDGDDFSTAHYWVCFYMPKYSTVEDGIHKDTKYLIINGNRKYISSNNIYTDAECTTADPDFKTSAPTGLDSLTGIGVSFDATKCPDDYQVMYYNTNVHPSTDTYNLTFTSEDTEGLSSSIAISNKAKQIQPPTISVVTDQVCDADEDTFLYRITLTHNHLCTDDTSCGSGVTINYTIEESNHENVFADGTSDKLSGSAIDSVSINLQKGTYKITVDAVKNFYIASEKAEVTGVRVRKPAIYYISQTGNDTSGLGSAGSPYQTIQVAIDKFVNDMSYGEYTMDANCYIRVLSDLTAPDNTWLGWSSNGNAYVKTPGSGYTGTMSITGWGGTRTIDFTGNGDKSGIIIGGSTVIIDKINITKIGHDGTAAHTIKINAGNVTYTNGSIYNCKGNKHGFIEVAAGKLTMSNVSFTDNSSGRGADPGAIKVAASAEVECTNCTFTNNASCSGGGTIDNAGTLTLTDCTIKKGSSSSHGGAISNTGTATLNNVSITECKAGYNATWSKNKGGAIYNGSSAQLTLNGVTISGCTFKDNAGQDPSPSPLGAAVYSEGILKLKGKNTIINNTLADGTTKSNIYIPTTKKLTILGDITGSKIGINVPWTAGASGAPVIGTPVAFTSGYDYPATNSVKPGFIFVAENGYGITPITTAGTTFGEAAFAVSSGAMYTALDYNFSFELKDVLGLAAHGFMPGKGASFTIIPTVKRTEPGAAAPTELYYNPVDKKLYETYDTSTGTYSSVAADGAEVIWTATLWNGSFKVGGDLTVSSTASGLKVSVPASVTSEDTYKLMLSATYLGVLHDAAFTLVCDNSAENAAAYISSLTTAGTYNVVVDGAVGSGLDSSTNEITSTDEGLAKVAKAIRSRPAGVLIKLDASGTSMGSSIETYNSGQYFKGCTALKEIKLPDWMEYVIPNLFSGCTNLSSVTLSENTKWICQNAFYGCSKLASITIPEGITGSDATHGIQAGAFTGCKSGFKIIYQGTKNQWSKVKRNGTWHDGEKETGDSDGSVTCTDGKCGFDYTSGGGGDFPDVNELDAAPNAADYSKLAVSDAEGFNKIAEWSATIDFQNITIVLQDDVTVEKDLMIKQFRGTFDGNNHSITQNFTISQSSGNSGKTSDNKDLYNTYKALFWTISTDALIKKLTVKGTATRSGLVGMMYGGTIEDCISEVEIDEKISSGRYLGGFVSNMKGGKIRNCVNKGTVKSTKGAYCAGGIAGDFSGASIENCINKGSVGADGGNISLIGGIAGYCSASTSAFIRNCKNTGSVTGNRPGGIVGWTSSIQVINCNNLGTIISSESGSEKSSGIVGRFCVTFPTIKNNCNIGNAQTGVIGFFNAQNSSEATKPKPTSSNIYKNYSLIGTSPIPTVLWGNASSDFSWASDLNFSEDCMKGFASGDASSILNELNSWATTNSTTSVTYASWKLNEAGLPELDLGELDNK